VTPQSALQLCLSARPRPPSSATLLADPITDRRATGRQQPNMPSRNSPIGVQHAFAPRFESGAREKAAQRQGLNMRTFMSLDEATSWLARRD
jgi:hypothetical protein